MAARITDLLSLWVPRRRRRLPRCMTGRTPRRLTALAVALSGPAVSSAFACACDAIIAAWMPWAWWLPLATCMLPVTVAEHATSTYPGVHRGEVAYSEDAL